MFALGDQSLVNRTGQHRDAVPADLVAEVLAGEIHHGVGLAVGVDACIGIEHIVGQVFPGQQQHRRHKNEQQLIQLHHQPLARPPAGGEQHRHHRHRIHRPFDRGLPEAQALGRMAEGQNGARFSRLLRERAAQRRALELIKQDLAQATALSETSEHEQHGCSLAGRTPVLHFSTAAGPITYSVALPPSAIWRGRVLMRCGPAVDLQGAFSRSCASESSCS